MMSEVREGPPRASRTQTVVLCPGDFDDMDTLMSRITNLVGRVYFPPQYFATPTNWNPHKLQLPDYVFKLLIEDESRERFHPDNSALAILATVRFLEQVEIYVSPPETFRRFTSALVQICASGNHRVHVLDLRCFETSIEEQTQNGIIEDLRLLVPSLTEAGFMFSCPNLGLRVVEEVLPLGKNLTALKFKVSTIDDIQSLLASTVFRVLRKLHLLFVLSQEYHIDNPYMIRLADAIQSHSSLRWICIERRFGDDRRLFEAILANPTIVHIEYQVCSFTMTDLLKRVSPHGVVYPRNVDIWDGEEHGLVFSVFPRNPSLLGWFNKALDHKTVTMLAPADRLSEKATEIVSPADLAMFATALRDPACALKNLRAVVAPKLEVSSEGFFAAVKESTSLRSLSVYVLPSAAPVVDVLRGNLYLKEFGWIGDLDLSRGGEALITAALANETIESYYFLSENSLWNCVSNRNMTLCVKRVRRLWICWVREWADHGCFEPALVVETIQLADLGWSEADRLNHQLEYELLR